MNEKIVTDDNRKTTTAIVGVFWGDEGKGKIASRESKDADLVVCGTGGANADHTVVFNGKKIALHLIPGGIVYPQTTCLIGQGLVVDIGVLIDEIEKLEKAGIPNVRKRLKISGRAHVVMPYHKDYDVVQEAVKENPVGTTKRGIGQAYADKDNRIGIQVNYLLNYDLLLSKVKEAAKFYNVKFRGLGFSEYVVKEKRVVDEAYAYGKVIRSMIVNGDRLVESFVNEGAKIVLEGALVGSHLNQNDVAMTIGIGKAYCSRVGNGFFPTELKKTDFYEGKMSAYQGEDAFAGETIREYGHEYGTTTGRPRRTGWLDLNIMRSAIRPLGVTYWCLNHLDTLGRVGETLGYVKMCIMYNYQGKIIKYFPDDMEATQEVPKPIYWTLKGGWNINSSLREYDQLPERAKTFIKKIEDETGIPVKFIGVGPDNEDLIVREDI
jgi:adenylosuccinate synthase